MINLHEIVLPTRRDRTRNFLIISWKRIQMTHRDVYKTYKVNTVLLFLLLFNFCFVFLLDCFFVQKEHINLPEPLII